MFYFGFKESGSGLSFLQASLTYLLFLTYFKTLFTGVPVHGVHVAHLPGHCVRSAEGGAGDPAAGGGLGPQGGRAQLHRQGLRRGEDGLAGGVLPHHW